MEDLVMQRKGKAVLVAYSGEITLDVTPALRTAIDEELGREPFNFLILDLSAVNFIDSSGIGFLVALSTRIEDSDNSFYLLRPGAQVLKTLELVQLKRYFKILRNDEELAALTI